MPRPKGFTHSAETKAKMSLARKGIVYSEETKEKMRTSHLGKRGYKHSEATKKKIGGSNSVALSGVPRPWRTGSNNPMWRGGVTKPNEAFRKSLSYRKWRTSVFVRDDYTCQICKSRGKTLHADHIKPFAYFPELRLDINNGRTLCYNCHIKTDTYSNRYKKYVVAIQ
jgi:hypothetical protein